MRLLLMAQPFLAPTRLGRLARFLVVGGSATLAYVAFALAFGRVGLAAAPASMAAHTGAGLMAYFGHRRITFGSNQPHSADAPRFLASWAFGLALATLIPLVLVERLGMPPIGSILITCAAIPALNFLLMDRLVFPARRA